MEPMLIGVSVGVCAGDGVLDSGPRALRQGEVVVPITVGSMHSSGTDRSLREIEHLSVEALHAAGQHASMSVAQPYELEPSYPTQ